MSVRIPSSSRCTIGSSRGAKNVLSSPSSPVAGALEIPVPVSQRSTRPRYPVLDGVSALCSYPQSANGQPKNNARSAIWRVPGAPVQMLTCARVISAVLAGWQGRQAEPDGPDRSFARRWTDLVEAVPSGGIRARHGGVAWRPKHVGSHRQRPYHLCENLESTRFTPHGKCPPSRPAVTNSTNNPSCRLNWRILLPDVASQAQPKSVCSTT